MIRPTRLLGVVIVVMLGGGAVEVSGLRAGHSTAPATVMPTFAPLPPTATVAELIAGIPRRDGRLLAVRTRRVLDLHAFPAELRINGQSVELGELVPAGSKVVVVPGRDRLEPVVYRRGHVAPLVTMQGKKRLVRPRVVVMTVGAVSGEELARKVVMVSPPPAPHRGSVLLTFDDGPDPTWTPQVLALLRQRHVHAIFCVVGREARKHPELLRQIVREGHQLCDHTQDHDEHLPADSPEVARLQIRRGRAAILDAAGIRAVWFRAPGGAWSPEVERLVVAEGMVPLKWTIDPRDWELPPASAIVGRVLAAAKPGGIVLLHDGGGDRAASVAALRSLLVALPRVGLSFAEPSLPAPPGPGSSTPHPTPGPTATPASPPPPTPTPTPSASSS